MIAIIRISGMIGIRKDLAETLYRLRLRRKFACVVIKSPTPEQKGMLDKIRDFVAYGELSDEVYKKLIEKRKTNIENFFRLHSPRGGFKAKGEGKKMGPTKSHYPQGVLGDHGKEINKLIERML